MENENNKSIRINTRVSKEYLKFLKQEAKLSGVSVSAICSMAISDYIVKRQIEYNKRGLHFEPDVY